MAISGGGSSELPSLPTSYPRSTPEYPDIYGKRREKAKVVLLEQEIRFLEEDLKYAERLQSASRCCKEYVHHFLIFFEILFVLKMKFNTQSDNTLKQQRKGEKPIRVPPNTDHSSDFGGSNSWLCKNSACRAVLSINVTFCKRCSCCICHSFDDNKYPSLWLECASESGDGYSCGLSCHIECALQRRRVGVVDIGQLMQLDGSYCCASCGKVSGILGCWKKQLIIAKDARRVDILCYRIFLSHRLLSGTSRFKEMHEIVNDPIFVFPRSQRRILISNLRPCTEYTFRIVSHLEDGDLGHSEAKCFTKSVEIIHKSINSSNISDIKKEKHNSIGERSSSCEKTVSEFKVRDLVKVLHLARAQRMDNFEECSGALTDNCRKKGRFVKRETVEEDRLPTFPLGIDLNIVSVPDLNEEFTPFEYFHDIEKNGGDHSHILTRGTSGEVPGIESQADRKRVASTNEGTYDCDSVLMNGSPVGVTNDSCSLDENFEYCVKMIRWLECEGYIKQDFRLKLLTWYSLRSSVQERRVVNTFIQTLIDDPSSLAGQLVDSFSDIISTKKPQNGFCSSLSGIDS